MANYQQTTMPMLDVMFGSPEFCEVLRKCRARGLTLGQIQILAALRKGPLTRPEISVCAGMTFSGVKKTVQFLINTGDVELVGSVKIDAYARLVQLTEQGKALVGCLKNG